MCSLAACQPFLVATAAPRTVRLVCSVLSPTLRFLIVTGERTAADILWRDTPTGKVTLAPTTAAQHTALPRVVRPLDAARASVQVPRPYVATPYTDAQRRVAPGRRREIVVDVPRSMPASTPTLGAFGQAGVVQCDAAVRTSVTALDVPQGGVEVLHAQAAVSV